MSDVDKVWDDTVKLQVIEVMKAAGVPDHGMAECGQRMLTEMTRWVANQNVTHFSHDYCVLLRKLQVEEGGGYMACIPQLGKGCFSNTADTIEETLNGLQELYDWLKPEFDEDKDWTWPEPKDEDCIIFGEPEEKLGSGELHKKFRGYLAEANINLAKRDTIE